MGTSASELRKALREDGLMSVLGFLREQMKTNEEAMSQVFGNVRALSGALDLMGENAQSNIQVFENLKNTTGDMQRAFDAASGSSTFKFNQAMAELKVASIDLGAALMPIFLDLVKVVKNLATWFTSLSTQSKRMVIMIGALAAAAGPALIVMGSMITVLTALSPVILAVVAAVGALAASFIYVYENWEAIKERVSDWGWWRNMLIDMIQFLVKYNPASMFIKSILDGWNWMAQKSGGIFRMWDFTIPDPFELAIEGLETLKAETTEYKHQFGSFTEAISSFAKRAGQAIAGMFPGGGGGGGGAAVSSLPAPVRNAAVLTPFTPKVNQDKRIFKDVIERDPALRERLIGPLKEAQQALDQLNATFEQMITGTIVEFGMAIGEMFAGNSNSMKTFLDGLMGQVANFMKMFGEALIASAFAAEAFQKLLSNPFAAIAAGSALIIAAGVVRGLLKKGPGGGGGGGGGRVQGLATGGVVTSGGVFQLHKDEMVALPRGAAVTPAHMVNGGGTGAGGGLSTSFGLRKMIIQLDRERERMKR